MVSAQAAIPRGSRGTEGGGLVEHVRLRARTQPHALVYRFLDQKSEGGQLLDCLELDRRASAIAARLCAMGATGQRALIVHPPGLEYIAALFGCWYAGVVAVPAFPPQWNRMDTRLRSIALDSQARFALSTDAWLEHIQGRFDRDPGLAALSWIATDRIAPAEGDGFEPAVVAPDAIALLQYTSGSTNAPKGVVLTQEHFLHNVRALTRRRAPTSLDRVVSWLPPYHDMGLVIGIVLPVCLGIEATLMSPSAFLRRPYLWLDAIGRYGGTLSGGPNFAYELCVRRLTAAQRGALDLRTWTSAFSGAERVRAGTLDRFASAFESAGFQRSAFSPCYGLAEATLAVSIGAVGAGPLVRSHPPEGLARGVATPPAADRVGTSVVGCGAPLPGCEVVVVHPDTRLRVAEASVGELWVRSTSVALGYWDKPELSEATFRARLADVPGDGGRVYLRTGDLGFLSEGEVYVTGRLKDLLILAGRNHYPDDIEAAMEGCHPDLRVGGGAAFSVEVDGEERLVVVHEVTSPHDGSLSPVAAAIRKAVAEAHELRVHDVVLVPLGGVPKTSSGKVQRGKCRELYQESKLDIRARFGGADAGRAVASDETVARVTSLMALVLGVASVRPEDDFFWMGGHSLMATQLVSRIREAMEVDLPLRSVFEAPTAAALAAHIQALPRRSSPSPIERVDRAGRLPLSFSQERMLFLHHLDPTSAAYNVAGAVAIHGPLDHRVLGRAVVELFERHDVLRSTYPTVNGQPEVCVGPVPLLSLDPVDLSAHSDAEGKALALASALAREPFDLARDTLVRMALYQTGPEQHLLAVSMHHMVTDAWSMGVLTRELLAFYANFAEGGAPPPRADEIGYVDYASWQRCRFAGDGVRGDLEYWRDTLRDVAPLELPRDHPRSARGAGLGALEPLDLPIELRQSLRELGAAHGATSFMVLLAAFVVVLSRHSGQRDFVVGVPIANRNHLASERLIGTLVNTLPLRMISAPEVTFVELLDRVRRTAIDAYSHQDLPFERLVAELQVERRAGESPLVQVMFDFQNAPMPAEEAGRLRIRPVMVERGASQFDLSLVLFDTELGHTALVEYATALFDASTIRRFLGHYLSVLQSVAIDPNQPISRIPLLTEREREELLALANGSFDVVPPFQSPARLFEERAAATPDAPAVSDRAGTLSYEALDRQASSLAARLVGLGVGPGRRVAVLLERSRDVVVALLAVLKTGAAYVPIDHGYPQGRIAFVLEDAEPTVVVTQTSLRSAMVGHLPAEIVCMDATEPDRVQRDIATTSPVHSDPQLPAYVLYTSGSTGTPKGVVVSGGALSNFLRSMSQNPGIRADDRVLSVTTIAFDISGLELWLPIVNGACVHIAPDDVISDGPRLRALVERFAPTLMQATPATWRLLIESGWFGDSSLRVLCGGETFPRDLAEQLLERAGAVWNMYGPTETTIWSTIHRVGPGDGAVPIGTPIDRTRVYILDQDRELVPLGVAGGIGIGGDGVAEGYLGRPTLTAARFVADAYAAESGARMYLTGDLGRRRSDGTLEHLGRLDDQIKLRGFRIEPGEIEEVLKNAGGAKDAVVVARERGEGNRCLVAYYVADTSTPGAPELRERLRTKLPPYMVPGAFVAVDALPKTPNGKIDRAALPAPKPSDVADDAPTMPRDLLEVALVRLWEEILAVNAPSIRADFFSLGGHSLLAVRLLARVVQEFDVDLPLRALLDSPTIESLATRIRASRMDVPSGSARFAHLVPIHGDGSGPPLVCVHGAGGHVLNMSAVAKHARLARPFVAFEARGTDGTTEPFTRIEEMATAYLRELRLVQPRGPYYLSGYCGGGLVAFEMATALQRMGEEVALLTLIDTYRPGSVFTRRYRRLMRRISAFGPRYLVDNARAALARGAGDIARRLAISYHRMSGQPLPHHLRDPWLTSAFLKAARLYRPGVFRGRLTILRATDVDSDLLDAEPDLGWRGFCSAGLDVHDIPGSHQALLEEPNVVVLGAVLNACVSQANASAPLPQRAQ